MPGRTADQAIRVEDTQDIAQQVTALPDNKEAATGSSDSEGFVQKPNTEDAIIVSSDSEEETQGAGSDEETVTSPIARIPQSADEADSRRKAIVASVVTREVKCLYLATKAG